MSNWQATLQSTERDVFGTEKSGSSLNLVIVLGLGLLAFGAGLFGLGIYHGFEHGTCSTTGYSGTYGPVPHCAKGIGWWMLMLMAGLVVAGVGAAMSGTLASLMTPALFVAIGAPFIALGLRGGNGHLLVGRSTSSGELWAAIFGACFLLGGLIWGACTMRRTLAQVKGVPTRLGGVLAAAAGVGAALAIAASVAGAIGPTAATTLQQASPVITQGTGFGGSSSAVGQANNAARTNAAVTRANAAAARKAQAAVKQATAQAQKLTKLAACVSAAGANAGRIQRCEAKFMP